MVYLAVMTVLVFVQVFTLFVRLLSELLGFLVGRGGGDDGPPPRPRQRGSLLFGAVLGVALMIGGVYVSDTSTKSPAFGVDARPMVNWNVVAKNFDSLTVMVKQGWAKLTG